MKNLLSIPGPDQPLMQGLSPIDFPYNGAVWFDGENVVFNNGAVGSMRGSEILIPQVADQMAQTYAFGARVVFFISSGRLLRWDSGVVTEISASVGAGAWVFQMYGNFLALVNGETAPLLWDGSVLSTLPIPGTTCRLLAKLGPHLIALGIDDDGTRIAWSDSDDLMNWDIVSSLNRAGALFLRDLDSPITAAMRMGSALAVYTADQMGLVNYVGGVFVFGFRARLDGIGATGPHAVASVGQVHFGFGRHGVWKTDGSQFTYVDNPWMHKFIQREVNWTQAHKVVAVHNDLEHMVEFYYPSTGTGSGENDKGVAFNYVNGTWTRFSFGARAALERDIFDYPLLAREDGIRLKASKGVADEDAWLQSAPTSCGAYDVYKRLQALRLGIVGQAELQIGVQEDLEDPVDYYWSGVAKVTLPLEDREGLFFTLKFRGRDWKLRSVLAKGVFGGQAL